MSLVSIKVTLSCDACSAHMIYTLDPAAVITETDLGDEVIDTITHMMSYEKPPNKKHEIETVIGGGIVHGIQLCGPCLLAVDNAVPEDRDISADDVRRVLAI